MPHIVATGSAPAVTSCHADVRTIEQAWALLPRLRCMSFAASPGTHSQTSWRGTGTACIKTHTDGACHWLEEQGIFTPQQTRQEVSFRNSYCWRRTATGLDLWHERFGMDDSVFLLTLVTAAPGRLQGRQPHHCGADVYRAELVFEADGFDLIWRVSGPRKDEHLAYRYRV